jgi:putative endonuclease
MKAKRAEQSALVVAPLSKQQEAARATAAKPWFLYLLRCRNGALYAGIATSVEERLAAHVAGKGARYTRSNPPVELIGSVKFPDRASASRAEHEIRQLRSEEKIAWLKAAARTKPRRKASANIPR